MCVYCSGPSIGVCILSYYWCVCYIGAIICVCGYIFLGLVLMCVYCPGASDDVCILFWG